MPMKLIKLIKLFPVFLLACTISATALAADPAPASKEEAMALVKRATQFAKQNGKEKAIAEFNKSTGQFVDRELYIVALDLNGILLANAGTNPKLLGKDLKDIHDIDNIYFTREELALAKGAGHGWINFKWPHPITHNLEPRSVYLERVDDYIVLAGVYTRK